MLKKQLYKLVSLAVLSCAQQALSGMEVFSEGVFFDGITTKSEASLVPAGTQAPSTSNSSSFTASTDHTTLGDEFVHFEFEEVESHEEDIPAGLPPTISLSGSSNAAPSKPAPSRDEFLRVLRETIEEIKQLPPNPNFKYAIIVDIDETLAFPFQPSAQTSDLKYQFLQHTLELCRVAREHHCLVIFVSARRHHMREATEALLAHAGFEPSHYELHLRPDDAQHAGQWKGSVRTHLATRVTIVATIDDLPENLDVTHGPTGRTIHVPAKQEFQPEDFHQQTKRRRGKCPFSWC